MSNLSVVPQNVFCTSIVFPLIFVGYLPGNEIIIRYFIIIMNNQRAFY